VVKPVLTLVLLTNDDIISLFKRVLLFNLGAAVPPNEPYIVFLALGKELM